jgi:hypothetical protein
MKKQVELLGRKVSVSLSASAVTALAQREQPIVAEMELYFSCLIRKKVRFRENLAGEVVNITEQLSVRFRPVMTAACGTDYEGDEPPLTDFPIKKADSFVPHWLEIDFKNGQWQGEFGF